MKKWWKKVRKFFARPGVLKWTIVLVTLVIVGGTIKALLWTIYTKDKPDFVPEDVREDIRGAIQDGGEAIKTISEPIGTAIVDAGYVKDCGCGSSDETQSDPTASWETYTDSTTGISMKYPEGWEVFEGEGGSFSIMPNEDSYDDITVFYSKDFVSVGDYWANYIKDWDATFLEPRSITYGDVSVMYYEQIDGMQGKYYVAKVDDYIYTLSANGEGHAYIEKIISTIN